jgi:hypothetical protein
VEDLLLGRSCTKRREKVVELFGITENRISGYGTEMNYFMDWYARRNQMNLEDYNTVEDIKKFFVDGGKEPLKIVNDLENLLEKFVRSEMSTYEMSKLIREENSRNLMSISCTAP